MSATCPSCYARQDAGLICHACASHLERQLAEVGAIVTELDLAISRQARLAGGGAGGLASEKDPWKQRASIAYGALENTLITWARDISGETWLPRTTGPRLVRRDPTAGAAGPFCPTCRHRSCMALRLEERRPAPPAAVQAAHYLLAEIPAIRKHPAADELVDEVLDAITQARRDIDRRADRRFVGPCLARIDGVTCTEDLYAAPWATEVRCRVCGTERDVAERSAWLLQQAAERHVKVREAAGYIGDTFGIRVTEDRIRGYLRRGRLTYRPPVDAGRFRLGDLLTLVALDAEKAEHTTRRAPGVDTESSACDGPDRLVG